jgi:hypothetical protein
MEFIMSKQQTISKPKAVKAAPKAKAVAPVRTMVYAALLAEALAGKFGALIQRFYVNALSYHMAQKTTFPRGRIANVALMTEEETRAFITAREQTSIPPGSLPAQRVFDQMMVETQTRS